MLFRRNNITIYVNETGIGIGSYSNFFIFYSFRYKERKEVYSFLKTEIGAQRERNYVDGRYHFIGLNIFIFQI